MFPWRKHTKKELMREYARLRDKLDKVKINKSDVIPFSVIGYKCSNIFFQYERMNTPGYNRPNSIEYWSKNKDKIIKFSKKQNRDYFSTINYFNHTPSQFPVLTAGIIYKLFKANKVLDPYAGWGDRCLASMALDIDYIGIDCNKNLKEPYEKLINYYDTNSNIDIIIDKSENVDIGKLDFDFVFTSPPFWRDDEMLEIYNYSDTNYKVFLKSLIKNIKICLSKGVWVCLYMLSGMYRDISKIIGKCKRRIHFKTNRTTLDTIYCF